MSLFDKRRREASRDLETLLAELFPAAAEPKDKGSAGAVPKRRKAASALPKIRPHPLGLESLGACRGLLLVLRAGSEAPACIAAGRAPDMAKLVGAAEGLAEAAAEEGEPEALISFLDAGKEGLAPSSAQALLFRMGAARAYGRDAEIILLSADFEARLRKAMERGAEVSGHPDSAQTQAQERKEDGLSGAAGSEGSAGGHSRKLAFERSADLALGRYLLPPRFLLPGAEALVLWRSVRELTDPSRDKGRDPDSELWLSASTGKTALGVFFAVHIAAPPGSQDWESLAVRASAVIGEGWKRAASDLAKGAAPAAEPAPQAQAPVPSLVRLPRGRLPEPPRGSLEFEGELRLGMGGLRLTLLMPPAFLGLFKTLAAQGERFPKPSPLSFLLAANGALLARWGEAYRRAELASKKPPGIEAASGLPSLASLLGLLDRRDRALLFQNCLVPELGAAGIRGLFHITRGRPGADGLKLAAPEPFDEAGVLSSLPDLALEEWDRAASTLRDSAWDGPRWRKANDEAVTAVCRALRSGRLALSPPVASLALGELGPRLSRLGQASLKALAAEGLPFGVLEGLKPRDLERILLGVSNRELALGCLGESSWPDRLKRHLSRSRWAEFQEDLESAKKRMEREEMKMEDALEGKRELGRRLAKAVAALKAEQGRDSPGRPDQARRPRGLEGA